jgi:uncharacterized protein YoxC
MSMSAIYLDMQAAEEAIERVETAVQEATQSIERVETAVQEAAKSISHSIREK